MQGPESAEEARPFLPYGRQLISDEDVAAVVRALRSPWLTTGPLVAEFERALAEATGAAEAVVVNSGTAALHSAMFSLGIGPGDEVIVPPMTFAATANCVVYQGGTPVFADVHPETLLIDPDAVQGAITPRTRAVIAVDYAGQPCAYERLRAVAEPHGVAVVADAAHALGGLLHGRRVGSLADLTTFSFHPVKHVTTGEGGAITTDDPAAARRMRMFRNHGITTDHREREARGSWHYEMVELGYNYRITELQCALGLTQLQRLGGWLARRREIAARYDEAFADVPGVSPLGRAPGAEHAFHLYVVRIRAVDAGVSRDRVYQRLRDQSIGVNVHYIPVHLHPFYRQRFGSGPGLCPVAEEAYGEVLSLPMFPAMTEDDVTRVVNAIREAVRSA